jgi:hypothetical protein
VKARNGGVIADVTRSSLPDAAFDIWHDRAVFHFLTKQEKRESYVKHVASALKTSGQVIIATFAINGPRSCSGLPVIRYDASSIQKQFGPAFRLVKSATAAHQTPAGVNQEFSLLQGSAGVVRHADSRSWERQGPA